MKNMPIPIEKEPKSKLQRALEMKAQMEKLLDGAKEETLAAVNQGIKDLAELGFKYHLLTAEEHASLSRPQMAATAPKTPRTASKVPAKGKEPAPGPSANYNENKKCPICSIDGHDGRAHRTHPAIFTSDELAFRGLQPLEGTPATVA